MKRTFVILVTVAIIAVLLLGSCAQQAPAPAPFQAPTPTTAPKTTAPEPTTSPTTKPAPTTAPVSGKPIELRFAHRNPPQSPTTVKYLNAWAQKVEEVTNNRIKITMYPAESLAKATEDLRAVMGGVSDITWLTLGHYPGRFPLSTVLELPFLAPDNGHLDGKEAWCSLLNGRILMDLYNTFPEMQTEWKDVKLLFLQTSSQKAIVSTKPIHNLNDVKGMKIVDTAGYPMEAWKLLGGSPMLMAAPDIYDAAQRKVIEMTPFAWEGIQSFRLYEVFKYWSDMTFNIPVFAIVMNLQTWNSLPADVQKAVESVSGYAGASFPGTTIYTPGSRDNVLALAEKQGFKMEKITLDAGEGARFIKLAGKPLWDKWTAELDSKGLPGTKILNETMRLIEKYK